MPRVRCPSERIQRNKESDRRLVLVADPRVLPKRRRGEAANELSGKSHYIFLLNGTERELKE